VPAPASLPIPAALDQFTTLAPPDPVALAPRLHDVLAELVDPRKPRGVRHRLVVVITVAVCAVTAGSRSFVAISEWVADLPTTVAEHPGVARADRFDAALATFVQQRCAALAPSGRLRALAIDGKTAHGSRLTARTASSPPGTCSRLSTSTPGLCSAR
jgi:hypothetical protein